MPSPSTAPEHPSADPEPPAPDAQATPSSPAKADEEPPPLGSWTALYALVVAALAVQIVAYLLLTRWAA